MLCIVWNLVRRRVTRRLTRLQIMYNFFQYSKTLWENDDISIYRYRTGTGNKFNLKCAWLYLLCINHDHQSISESSYHHGDGQYDCYGNAGLPRDGRVVAPVVQCEVVARTRGGIHSGTNLTSKYATLPNKRVVWVSRVVVQIRRVNLKSMDTYCVISSPHHILCVATC